MSHITTIDYSSENAGEQRISLENSGQTHVDLPDASFVTDADIVRDGVDLVLKTPDGTVIIEGYFAAELAPQLVAPDGTSLTPALVDSFVHGAQEYASAMQTANDVSPIGAVQEISGDAHVTRVNGTVEIIGVGTPIYQGDIVETDEDGAVNIMFIDETTFAVSEDARLAIDEYVFDPATQSGTTNFSVLKGVFVFTSGLIGREDPDDVTIETPSGSIGIRGTIIVGNVSTGEITVIEGAIVLSDLNGHTITLSNQFETARFNTSEGIIDHIGELAANDVSSKYSNLSGVAANLFSSIEETAQEEMESNSEAEDEVSEEVVGSEEAAVAEEEAPQEQAEDGVEGDPADEAKAAPVEGGEAQDDTPTEPAGEDLNTDGNQLDGTEIITSDDITGSSTEDTASDGNEVIAAKPLPLPVEDMPEATTNEPPPQDLVANTVEEKPPFGISINRIAVGENINDAAVAKVTGQFAQYTNLQLIGTSQNYYELDRQDDNSFIVKLKTGVSLDAEAPHKLAVKAVNGAGTESVIKNIDLNIVNQNETVEYLYDLPAEVLSGTENSILHYDLSQHYVDHDGLNVTYSATITTSSGDTNTFNLTSDGQLTIEVDSIVTADSTLTFDVTATSADGSFDTRGFSYEIEESTSAGGVIFAAGTYHSTSSTVAISSNDVSLFTYTGVAGETITVNGLRAEVWAGEGDDEFIVNSTSNYFTLFGGEGNDEFHVTNSMGKSYGGAGNDTFVVEDNSAYLHLRDFDGSVNAVDGGTGYDILHFTAAGIGTIDIDLIDNDIINNIEMINTENGSIDNIVLTYDDVFDITDSDNRLMIKTDNDDVSFTNTSGNDFFQLGNQTVDSEEYNVFTDGTITLLVDTDADVVTGII